MEIWGAGSRQWLVEMISIGGSTEVGTAAAAPAAAAADQCRCCRERGPCALLARARSPPYSGPHPLLIALTPLFTQTCPVPLLELAVASAASFVQFGHGDGMTDGYGRWTLSGLLSNVLGTFPEVDHGKI